jgi:pSer/pThr/pTyr-binding forkhead associated (FHA) protein
MAVLIGMSTTVKGRKFDLDQDEIFLGRNPQNQIILDDASISGRHCSITRDGHKYFLVDLGSTNGTRLNGGPVTKSPLRPKDIVQVGAIELMFDGQDVEVAAAPSHETAKIEEVDSEPAMVPTSFKTASPFGSRRDSRKPWIIATAVLILVVLGALAYFIVNLFGNG